MAMLLPLLLSRTESKDVKKDAANRQRWKRTAEANCHSEGRGRKEREVRSEKREEVSRKKREVRGEHYEERT